MGKIYFVSDLHLGVNGATDSKNREAAFVRWLHMISADASALYLMGDLFDFYFEYKKAVPKGHVRILGALAQLSDGGLPIYFFTGNHDMWIFRYFEEELGIPTYREPIEKEIQGKKVFLGHGDGLGPGDKGYKIIKQIFANRVCQWLFERIHPNTGISIAEFWSRRSRYANPDVARFEKDTEWLVNYAQEVLVHSHFDYFIFGHRHLPVDHKLIDTGSRYINLGEWLYSRSYAEMEAGEIQIKFFENDNGKIFG
jgi:UDP-2,3-diacylglucosamine hydrolase